MRLCRAALRVPLALLAGVAPAVVGCGADEPPPQPRAAVELTLAEPADEAEVRASSVQVRGSVRPAGARVTVDGRAVAVTGGAFAATVELEPGTNVIDVLASTRDHRPALTAVRVRRLVTVSVPDLAGADPDEAAEELESLGLRPRRVTGPVDFFDELLGREPVVCGSSPRAGTDVDPGSTVELDIARRC